MAEILRKEPEARAVLIGLTVTLVCKRNPTPLSPYLCLFFHFRYWSRNNSPPCLESRRQPNISDWFPIGHCICSWQHCHYLCSILLGPKVCISCSTQTISFNDSCRRHPELEMYGFAGEAEFLANAAESAESIEEKKGDNNTYIISKEI